MFRVCGAQVKVSFSHLSFLLASSKQANKQFRLIHQRLFSILTCNIHPSIYQHAICIQLNRFTTYCTALCITIQGKEACRILQNVLSEGSFMTFPRPPPSFQRDQRCESTVSSCTKIVRFVGNGNGKLTQRCWCGVGAGAGAGAGMHRLDAIIRYLIPCNERVPALSGCARLAPGLANYKVSVCKAVSWP